MPEDVALLQQLGVNAYRFSVAWPRVMPEGKGRVNVQGLDFYERLVDALLAAEIAPMITLYHWDLPLALQAQYGGWLHRDVAQLFADYAEQVVRRLGDRVSWWMTINEPWSVAVHGYAWGNHPPHAQDSAKTLQVAHHLLLAHGFAVERMRQQHTPAMKIGIALNLSPIYPADHRAATLQAAYNARVWYNFWMLDPLFRGQYPEALATQEALAAVIQSHDLKVIAARLDFLGVNYYSRLVVKAASSPSTDILTGFTPVIPVPEASYSQMGWETYAEGLRDILATIHDQYHPPQLLVTENGAAYTDEYTDLSERIQDHRRVAYLQEHLAALQRALQQGIPIKGYCAWTLMDNFEWTDGYHQRFGLAAVHPVTRRRILKESGHWYAHFIAAQRVSHVT